jgi:hypothetical protein
MSARQFEVTSRDLKDARRSARYLFPSDIGGWVLGLPTAYSIKELADGLMPEGDPVVMPLSEGPERGRALEPIHPLAPLAAARDPLYQIPKSGIIIDTCT